MVLSKDVISTDIILQQHNLDLYEMKMKSPYFYLNLSKFKKRFNIKYFDTVLWQFDQNKRKSCQYF